MASEGRWFESTHDGKNPCRKPQGASETKNNKVMKKRFENWMAKNNMTFSAICGETFTNREVVYAHIGLVVFLIVVGIAGNF